MYNKELNLTEEDILQENNIAVINAWKLQIEKELLNFQVYTSRFDHLNGNQKRYYTALNSMRKICKSKITAHINKLKEDGVWKSSRDIRTKRHLASVFMEEAKKILPPSIYKQILEVSQNKMKQTE